MTEAQLKQFVQDTLPTLELVTYYSMYELISMKLDGQELTPDDVKKIDTWDIMGKAAMKAGYTWKEAQTYVTFYASASINMVLGMHERGFINEWFIAYGKQLDSKA